jgi:hypothetical protein
MNGYQSYSASGVFVADSTNTVTVSMYVQGTAGGSMKAQQMYLTATRIA